MSLLFAILFFVLSLLISFLYISQIQLKKIIIAEIAEEYFDLKRDYTKIKERLTRIDKHMQTI